MRGCKQAADSTMDEDVSMISLCPSKKGEHLHHELNRSLQLAPQELHCGLIDTAAVPHGWPWLEGVVYADVGVEQSLMNLSKCRMMHSTWVRFHVASKLAIGICSSGAEHLLIVISVEADRIMLHLRTACYCCCCQAIQTHCITTFVSAIQLSIPQSARAALLPVQMKPAKQHMHD